MTDAVKMAIERIKARFHPHYGIDGASDSKQLASDCQTLIAALEQAGEPVDPKVMLSLVEARRIADAIVEHCRGADFSCDMKAATKDVMRLVNVDMRLCRHQAQPGISRSQRPDLQAWQDAQSEYFDDTIIGIVTEYAEWRDAQQLAEAPLPTLQRLGQEFDAGEVEPFAYMLRDSDGKVFWDEDMCIWTHREDAEEAAEDKGMTMFGVYDGPVPPLSRGQAFDGELPLKFDPRDAKRWWEENMRESKFVSARLAGDGYVKFHWRDADESGDYSVPWTRIALWLAALSSAKRGEGK